MSKKQFRITQESRVRTLSRYTRAKFYSDSIQLGIDGAATFNNVDRYTISTTRRLHCAWLRSRPNLPELAARARRLGNFSEVARRFGLSNPFEISYLLRFWKRVQDAAKQAAAHARDAQKWLVNELRWDLQEAVETIRERMKQRRWSDRPEFDRSELSRTKKCRYGWVLDYIRLGGYVPEDLVAMADTFLGYVEQTFEARAERRLRHLRQNNLGATPATC